MPETNKPVLLWIENDYPINSRSARIIESVVDGGLFEVHCCVWTRSMQPTSNAPHNYHFHRGPASAGVGRLLLKAIALPSFAVFALRIRRRLQPRLVVCSFWDMAMTAAFVAGRTPIIYDVVDMPRGRGPQLIIAKIIERLALTRINAVTLASRFYEPFYKTRCSCLILENLPDLPAPAIAKRERAGQPRIAFVGHVRYPTTLRPLLRACEKAGYPCDIIGDGESLGPLAAEFRGSSHIRFTGRYRYQDLPHILQSVDILWAAYPAYDFNVRHAISNKFFESIYYALPGVFSRSTLLGDLVESEGIGFVLDATDEGEVARWLANVRERPAALAQRIDRLVQYRDGHWTKLRWNDQEARLNEFFRAAALGTRPQSI